MIKQSSGNWTGDDCQGIAVSKISFRLNSAYLNSSLRALPARVDAEKITKSCAQQLTFVWPARAGRILDLMMNYNDFSLPFAQTMILKTPASQRAKKPKGTKTPWDPSSRTNRPAETTEGCRGKHDFYSNLYRQNSINLLKLVIYVRS